MTYNGRAAKMIAGLSRLAVTDADFPELPPDEDLRQALGNGGETLRETRQSSSPDVQAVDKEQFRIGVRSASLERRRAELLDHADECLVTEVSEELRDRPHPAARQLDGRFRRDRRAAGAALP